MICHHPEYQFKLGSFNINETLSKVWTLTPVYTTRFEVCCTVGEPVCLHILQRMVDSAAPGSYSILIGVELRRTVINTLLLSCRASIEISSLAIFPEEEYCDLLLLSCLLLYTLRQFLYDFRHTCDIWLALLQKFKSRHMLDTSSHSEEVRLDSESCVWLLQMSTGLCYDCFRGFIKTSATTTLLFTS